MAIFRRAVLATALVGTGLATTTGAAFAGEAPEHDEGTEQNGVVNVGDVQTVIPTNICNNNVPVNVLGVQVPIQDVAGNVPILSPSEGGSGNGAGVSKSCGNEVAAEN